MSAEHHRLPPSDAKIEEAVLGAMLLEADGLRIGLARVPAAEAFYNPANQHIYRACQQLFNSGAAVDIATVTIELRRMGVLDRVGGPQYVAQLTYRIQSAAHLETHCLRLLELYCRRESLKAARKLLDNAADLTQDPLALIAGLSQTSSSLSDMLALKRPERMSELYRPAIDRIIQATQHRGLTGVPCGIRAVDKYTGGWQPGNLVILAGRPAMGKTTLALAFARNAAIGFGKRVAFFSLEMSKEELATKLIATEAEYSTNQLTQGNLSGGAEEAEYIGQKAKALQVDSLVIDDTPAITLAQLRAKCAKLKAEQGLDMVVIDYLQLMTGDSKRSGGNRENEIGTISRGLKALAKELRIPIIALAQLSRDVEKRGGDKRPMLSDLRESGAIEQDADMVIFPYRPEYYGITEDELGNSLLGMAEIIIAKHRNGGLGSPLIGAKMEHGRFYDLEEPPAAPPPPPTNLPPSDFDLPTEAPWDE